ncbi:ABC transporter ATP-binding protein [Ktedonosporobacter rubrisoli]|uniref:Spermidine/putrescine import ATP-binding protein PotA n=1 Tax=Ktedonosporobacter rubrisoli TaxID=2509675 RepID=A0A4P6K2R5_KTERU|nr:ABC transporter ATP-binding protein [Ktedonosporobacter rubrisoli]QBD81776.1 ABC transporter ATP-binding protein [Ktedonosporobacter rubrisoli]
MAFLELKGLTKRFGQVTAVDQIALPINQGEFLTLLGPSGCGKTTILRMVAGFEMPDEGSILLDGDDITHRPASKRPMGMVFQSYALFPHMTAEQNIAFGMEVKKQPREQIKKRCAELLELVGLGEMGKRYPHQLSGGQQQRIALARALAVEPKVLLLDEPLSALDAKVRVSLRNEIRRIQQQLKMTAIYVTHDQEEALAVSDRIAVMAKGKIEQLDHPEEIYVNPHTVFAATFVGTSNQFNGVLESAAQGLCKSANQTFHVLAQSRLRDNERVLIVVRPEEVSLHAAEEGPGMQANGVANSIAGVIELRTFLGPFTRFHVKIDDSSTLIADVPSQQGRGFAMGQQVRLSFRPEACQVLPLDAREEELEKIANADAV